MYLTCLITLTYILVVLASMSVFATPKEKSYSSGQLDSINDYIGGQITILTRAIDGENVYDTIYTASEHFLDFEGGKDYNMFGILVCEPAEDGYFKVISMNFTLTRDVEGGMKGEVVIPEGGLIFGVNGQGISEYYMYELKDKAKIGDYIKFDGLDLEAAQENGEPIHTTSVTFSLYHDISEPDDTPEPTAEDSKPDNGKNNYLIWIIIGGVLLVVIIVGAVVFFVKKK